MRNPPSLFFCDLDNTLVDTNLEKNFIKYSLIRSNLLFPFCFNLVLHYFVKSFFYILRRRFSYKFFYYNLSQIQMSKLVDKWISSDTFSSINLNFNILNQIEEKDILIILTNCPDFNCIVSFILSTSEIPFWQASIPSPAS